MGQSFKPDEPIGMVAATRADAGRAGKDLFAGNATGAISKIVGSHLSAMYQEVISEPAPDAMLALLRKLDRIKSP